MAYTYGWADKTHIDKAISLCSIDLATMECSSPEKRRMLAALLLRSGVDYLELGSPAENDDDQELLQSVHAFMSAADTGDSHEYSVILLNVTPGNHNIRKTFELARLVGNTIIMLDIRNVNDNGLINTSLKLMKKLAGISDGDIGLGIRCRYRDVIVLHDVLTIWQPSASFRTVISIHGFEDCLLPNIYACKLEKIINGLFANESINHVSIAVQPCGDIHLKEMKALYSLFAGADIIEGTIIFDSFGRYCDLIGLDMVLSDVDGYVSRLERQLSGIIREEAAYAQNDYVRLLKMIYGFDIPLRMQGEVRGYLNENVTETDDSRISGEVFKVFRQRYSDCARIFRLTRIGFQSTPAGIVAEVVIENASGRMPVTATGTGRLDAVINAIKVYYDISFELSVYDEQLLMSGSSSKAVTYIGLSCNGVMYWGVGVSEDMLQSAMDALVTAVNRISCIADNSVPMDARLNEILGYIQKNYRTVTLDELSEHLYLSKEYISKYIKIKSGITFSETLRNVRLKKAKALLKNRDITVENIAVSIGYQNSENFIRHFRKKYKMTPLQYRNRAGCSST